MTTIRTPVTKALEKLIIKESAFISFSIRQILNSSKKKQGHVGHTVARGTRVQLPAWVSFLHVIPLPSTFCFLSSYCLYVE